VKREEINVHLQQIGKFMQRILVESTPAYAEKSVCQMFGRLFGEHFQLSERVLEASADKDLSTNGLQSPDDFEDTNRKRTARNIMATSLT
jgi:hypothetical protein